MPDNHFNINVREKEMLALNYNDKVERWCIFELELKGPDTGNPFKEIKLNACFKHKNRTVVADGFYDGEGVHRVRFMPDITGQWSFVTESNCEIMDGVEGSFECVSPGKGNNGPVYVYDDHNFTYANGLPYYPFGTTLYAWIHQGDLLEEQTLESLKNSPFNKVRMMIFPKHLFFNNNEPVYHPFERNADNSWNFSRFNIRFFKHLERRLNNLLNMGIEADLILFHPYDCWGYSTMDPETDDFYLNYVVARLAAYRNIWWSLANEYDIMKSKKMTDWDRFFKVIQECDPYGHLRSIHYLDTPYDYGKPWVTHQSIQSFFLDFRKVQEWRNLFKKPVVLDEYGYEGNVNHAWGSLTGQELLRRSWEIVTRGGYASGHGETFLHPQDILWWSKGGTLQGESFKRINFLKRIMEEGPEPAKGLKPIVIAWDVSCIGVENEYYLIYFGFQRPAVRPLQLPEDVSYTVEIIDTWDMTITQIDGIYKGEFKIDLPGIPYIALRIKKI